MGVYRSRGIFEIPAGHEDVTTTVTSAVATTTITSDAHMFYMSKASSEYTVDEHVTIIQNLCEGITNNIGMIVFAVLSIGDALMLFGCMRYALNAASNTKEGAFAEESDKIATI